MMQSSGAPGDQIPNTQVLRGSGMPGFNALCQNGTWLEVVFEPVSLDGFDRLFKAQSVLICTKTQSGEGQGWGRAG